MMNVAYEQNPENIFFSKEDLKNYQIYELFEQCIEEIKTRQYGYDTLIGTNIAKLLTYLSRIWISKGIAVDEKILCASAPDNPFDNITEYIDRHYNEQLQVKELAKMCNMSYSNFARSFKQLYNQSCKEYIEFIRLNRVVDLLIYTDLDLNYISQETGFSDCSHLIRSFKHWKGMTPKVWRREYGNSVSCPRHRCLMNKSYLFDTLYHMQNKLRNIHIPETKYLRTLVPPIPNKMMQA